MERPDPQAPTRILLRVPVEAAAAMGVSDDYFTKRIRADLKLIRRGRFVFVRPAELERWARENETWRPET